jgi:hypothetical protein
LTPPPLAISDPDLQAAIDMLSNPPKFIDKNSQVYKKWVELGPIDLRELESKNPVKLKDMGGRKLQAIKDDIQIQID